MRQVASRRLGPRHSDLSAHGDADATQRVEVGVACGSHDQDGAAVGLHGGRGSLGGGVTGGTLLAMEAARWSSTSVTLSTTR